MAARKWYDNDTAHRRAGIVMVGALIVLGPGAIGDMVEDPTLWTVALVVIWTTAVAVYGYALVRRRFVPTSRRAVDTETVPDNDVTTAIADTTSRVAAVKRLREMHPGLSLGDAAHLVDNHQR